MTGGRLKRVIDHYLATSRSASPTATACRDVKVDELIKFHRNRRPWRRSRLCSRRDGSASFTLGRQRHRAAFREKPREDGSYINGGYLRRSSPGRRLHQVDLDGLGARADARLARAGQVSAYRHDGFWQPMDTLRDKTFWRTCGKAARRRGRSGEAGVLRALIAAATVRPHRSWCRGAEMKVFVTGVDGYHRRR